MRVSTPDLANAMVYGALVVALGAAAGAIRSERKHVDVLRTVSRISEGARLADRLIGVQLEPPMVSGENETVPPTSPSLIWVVDAARCSRCFTDLTPWNRLAETRAVSMFLLLLDADSAALRASEQLRNTSVQLASRTTITKAFGDWMPSTKLLLSSDGIVLLADGRPSGAECDWSFEIQVSALLGFARPDEIRLSTAGLARTPLVTGKEPSQ